MIALRLRRGAVVLVPFPFSDLSGLKKRPALVLSTEAYNAASPDVVIGMITSRVSSPPRPGDYRIARWQEAGLLVPSLFRSKLTTLEGSQVLRVMGAMPAEDMKAIDRALAQALGLAA